jgi:hypothetical protein
LRSYRPSVNGIPVAESCFVFAMLDFEVQRCTRRCAATDRELAAGEAFYSVLVAEGGQVRRHDYSAAAWPGPPEGALGWWQSQMPDKNAHKLHWAPNDVMLHYFEQLESRPEKADVRYVLTLLLIRRRVLRLEQTERGPEGEELVVLCPRNEADYRVKVAHPAEQRIAEIQRELATLLFGGAE